MNKPALLLLPFLLFAVPGRAATVGGVTFPDSYPVNGQTLRLNGLGLRTLTVLNVRAYAAGLYLAQPSHDPAAIEASPDTKVLLLQYLHAGSKEQVQRQYRAGEQVNCGTAGACPQSDQGDFERLVASVPAVKVGDTTTFIFTKTGVRVLSNNQPLGSYDNPDLARRLLDGFIGPRPPSPALRAALLGTAAR